MEKENPVDNVDKENTMAYLRNKMETWREERYEKLCSRLMRFREDGGSKDIPPSILGMKCPKNISERANHQYCKSQSKKKPLEGSQNNKIKRRSGIRHGLLKRFPEGPPVRQTVTSKLRVLQNNPFVDGHLNNNCGPPDLNGTVVRKNLDLSTDESPEAVFSTPAIQNHHPQFPDSASLIKPVKSPTQIVHSKTFLKYD